MTARRTPRLTLRILNLTFHSVAIVGYTKSGDFIYYDPYYYNWLTGTPDNFNGAYNIAVKGIKEYQEDE